jgi:hypothetical protein
MRRSSDMVRPEKRSPTEATFATNAPQAIRTLRAARNQLTSRLETLHA